MVDMALRVAGALKAWASDTNNAPIRQEASINKTTFSRGRDDLRDDIAQQIHDLGNANVAALAPFGVTAATISALQTRIDVYRAAIGSPQAARAQKVTATSLLVNEFDRADMILADRIDGLIEQFKSTRTTFYSDYKNSRKIVQTGNHSATTHPRHHRARNTTAFASTRYREQQSELLLRVYKIRDSRSVGLH